MFTTGLIMLMVTCITKGNSLYKVPKLKGESQTYLTGWVLVSVEKTKGLCLLPDKGFLF